MDHPEGAVVIDDRVGDLDQGERECQVEEELEWPDLGGSRLHGQEASAGAVGLLGSCSVELSEVLPAKLSRQSGRVDFEWELHGEDGTWGLVEKGHASLAQPSEHLAAQPGHVVVDADAVISDDNA